MTNIELAKTNLEEVVVPACVSLLNDIFEIAPYSNAFRVMHVSNSFFLAGMQYAIEIIEEGNAIESKKDMQHLLMDVHYFLMEDEL